MNKTSAHKRGLTYALACSVLWGIMPIYWHWLRPIESSVIIFYRIFLVGVVCFILSWRLYGMKEIKRHLSIKGARSKFFLAGLLITVNWSIYIWAVNADHVIQTCVGYYIEPLMVSVFGIIFFKEKLSGYKLTALIFACIGVVVMLLHYMEVPLIALSISITFATYAALKKSYNLPPLLSLFYETMYIMFPALAVIIYIEVTGQGAIGIVSIPKYFLLLLCGPLTVIALALFAEATNHVPLVTMGLIEYISPSLALILGIFLFKEPFDLIQFIAFVIVWIGLVFFTAGEIKVTENKTDFFNIFDDYDRFRFPGPVERVTAGHGGEALLIVGSEKTALLDCGMAYCGNEMVANIRKSLEKYEKKSLDYVLLSHSHYDHIGALPHVLEAFPEVVVYGSEHCANVLKKPGARRVMKELGETARRLYRPESSEDVPVDTLKVDIVLRDGDVLSLGQETIRAIETGGHTDCSMSFVLEPQSILFASESTGILEAIDYVHTPILKSYDDSLESMRKCMASGCRYLCLPHFGMIPENVIPRYWKLFDEACHEKLAFIKGEMDKGMSENEIMEKYTQRYWTHAKEQEQPREAFIINSRNILKVFMKKARKMEEKAD